MALGNGHRPDERIKGKASLNISLKAGTPPKVWGSDKNGRSFVRTVSLVDILEMIDESASVRTLKQTPASRTRDLPPLPPRTILASLREHAGGRVDACATAWTPPRARTIVLRAGGEDSVHEVVFPTIVYSARVNLQYPCVVDMCLALAPGVDEPNPDTPLYHYPLSNMNAGLRVCWPTIQKEIVELRHVEDGGLERFLSVPNNGDAYGLGRSHNAPIRGYREFLVHAEKGGGFDEDWLIPTGKTVAHLHENTK